MARLFNRSTLLVAVLGLALIGLMVAFLPQAIDLHFAYIPAIREMLAGRSPFDIPGYFNAPWVLIPLLPLAFLPETLSRALLALATLAAFGFTTRRLGGGLWAVVLVLISPPVLHNVLTGNVDWMVALGFILPPQWGLLLVAIKPQMGSVVALFWLVETWRNKGFKEVIRVFAPVTVAFLISFALYGFWPLHFQETPSYSWNSSLWPMSIPIGLALAAASLRSRKIHYAMAASPFVTPYLIFHTWSASVLGLVDSLPELGAAVGGLWILIIYRALQGVGM